MIYYVNTGLVLWAWGITLVLILANALALALMLDWLLSRAAK